MPHEHYFTRKEHDSHCIVFESFDTLNTITLYHTPHAADILHDALYLCRHFHRIWNFSDKHSDIACINAARAPQARVAVDPDTAALVSRCLELGAEIPSFNCAAGALTYLWKKTTSIPSDADIEHALAHSQPSGVSIEHESIVKHDPLLQVDIGGAAKGYAADAVCALLRNRDVRHAAVDMGGSLAFLGGHPEGRPWRVRLGSSSGPVTPIDDAFISTSGDAHRGRTIENRAFSHIIDPSTGHPATPRFADVTVVARSGLTADVLSTAALVSGEGVIERFGQCHPGCIITSHARSVEDAPH